MTRLAPLIGGSFGMSHGEVRNNYDVDGVGCFTEMGSDGFLYVAMKLVQSLALREYILAKPAGAPVLAVKVGFHLDQHEGSIP